jgi:hypothetical protein
MFKKLVIVCGITLLFLTACGSDEDSAKPAAEDEEATPAAAATVEPTEEAAPTVEPTEEATSDGPLGGSFEPLSLLAGPMFGGGFGDDSFDMAATAQEVSPDLEAVLLTEEDLPPGYNSFGSGDFGFSFDTPEGHMEMAMRMFFEGDMMSGEFSSVVMPVVMSMPASALDDFGAGFGEMEDMDFSDEEFKELMGDSGMEYKEFEVFEAPGLGEDGIGMHMVIEMDASAFGADLGEGMEAFQGGLAYDMYMFTRGDRMFMLMSMWPAVEPAPVDALALAEVMDARAQ